MCLQGKGTATFFLVTVSRRVSYLDITLQSYARERVWAHDGVGLSVVDLDNSTSASGVYKLRNRTVGACDGSDVDGITSCKTRQTTLDITASLLVCAQHTSGWVVLVEDDDPPCEGALDELVGALGKPSGMWLFGVATIARWSCRCELIASQRACAARTCVARRACSCVRELPTVADTQLNCRL